METILSNIPAKAYAIALLIIGTLIRHHVKSRRFHRINKQGVSEFTTYGHKVFFTAFEKLLMIIGRLLIVTGLLVLGLEWINHKK